jgi:5-methylcytosine-specific restriction endonuclease McrA
MPVKQSLWDSGMKTCQGCGKEFQNLKGIEIHRKDSSLEYSTENCELLCRPCHQRQ